MLLPLFPFKYRNVEAIIKFGKVVEWWREEVLVMAAKYAILISDFLNMEVEIILLESWGQATTARAFLKLA